MKHVAQKLMIIAALAFAGFLFLGMQGVKAGLFDYNPFVEFGKWLPWQKNEVLVLTATPDQNKSWYGEYAQNFAKNGGDAATIGILVHAISDGVVKTVAYDSVQGNYVEIDHRNGYMSRYSHLATFVLNSTDIGHAIRAGQEIGTIGRTGNVTAANLLFKLFYNGVAVKATSDGIAFTGYYSWSQSNVNWLAPVDNFDKYQYSIFSSVTDIRPVVNAWDPPAIDPLDRYLENYGYLFPSGMLAEPVNVSIGMFVNRQVDLDLLTQHQMEFKLERFYNSADSFYSPYGPGWEDSLNVRILAHDTNMYTVKFGDGHGETFQETDSDPNTFTSTFTNVSPEALGTLERLPAGSAYKFKYTAQDKNVYLFNSDVNSKAWGKVEKITSLDGYNLNFTNDANGNLTQVYDGLGSYINFTYSGSLRVSATDQGGRANQYTYTFDGRLATATKPNGGVWQYTYGASGRLWVIKDPDGKTAVTNNFSASGQIGQQYDGRGSQTAFQYNNELNILGQPDGNVITTVTDPNGGVTVEIHDSNLYLISKKMPSGSTTTYKYNAKGQKTEEKDGNGNVTAYEYDSAGNQIKLTRPDGYVQTTTYNSLNLPLTITDPSGVITNTYNAAGKLTSSTNPLGAVHTYTYNAQNQLTAETNENGNVKNYTYNTKGLLATEKDMVTGAILAYEYGSANVRNKVTDPLGRITSFSNTTLGLPGSVTNPNAAITAYWYNLSGNLIKVQDPLGHITTYDSDSNDNVIKTTDPDGYASQKVYDLNNNVIQDIDRAGYVTWHQYDGDGRLTASSTWENANLKDSSDYQTYDANGNVLVHGDSYNNQTKYEYDTLNRIAKVTDAIGSIVQYHYDILGRKTEEIDAEGNDTKYEYDALEHLTKKTDALLNVTTYTYDNLGNKLTETDANGGVTIYTYDSQNKVSSVKNVPGSTATNTYDLAGNLLTQKDFSGATTSFVYDGNDNITKKTDALGRITQFVFDADNNLTKLTDPKGYITQYQYDLMNKKTKETNPAGKIITIVNGARNIQTYTGEDGGTITYSFDGLNRQVFQTDQLGHTSYTTYDQNGNVLTSKDRNGNTTSNVYDKLNRITQSTNALGEQIQYQYSAKGNLLKLTDGRGNTKQFQYDALGRATQSTDQTGALTTYFYDKLGKLTETDDPLAGKTKSEYDGLSRKTAGYDQLNNKTSYSYDAQGRLTQKTDAPGGIWKTQYDAVGEVTSQTDPLNGTKSYAYDADGNQVSVTDERALTTNFAYDNLNRKTTITDALGGVTAYTYDDKGRVTKLTDANGKATNNTYDSLNLTKQTDANTGATNFTYDNNQNLLTQTDARSNKTIFTYDANNRQLTKKLPGGATYTYTYDTNGNRLTQKLPLGGIYSYEYDARNLKTKQTDPAGNITGYEYDVLGRMSKQTDGEGKATVYSYDASGRLTEVTDALGGKTDYNYDVLGNLSKETNALANATNYEYDALSHLTKETNPLAKVTAYTYDASGNIASRTKPDGTNITYSYNALNFLTAVNYGDAAQNETYTYNAVGKILTAKKGTTANQSFTYDNNYQLLTTTDRGKTFSYTYDLAGNVTKVTYPDAKTESLAYNTDNLPSSLSLVYNGDPVAQNTPQTLQTNFSYDSNGNLLTQANPDYTKTTFEYDAANRTTKVNNQILKAADSSVQGYENFNYQYNHDNNLTTVTIDSSYIKTGTTLSSSNRRNYSYDALQRLTNNEEQLKQTDGTYTMQNAEAYQYDAAGNRTQVLASSTLPGQPIQLLTNFTYNTANQLQSDNGHTYTYDANGNQTQVNGGGSTVNNTFNKADQLTYVDQGSAGKYTYTVDAFGRRITTTNTTPSATGALNGINKIDYFYLGKSFDTLADYYDRIDVPSGGVAADYFDVHANTYKLGSRVIAADNVAERAMPVIDPALAGQTVLVNPDRNQILNYFFADAKGSTTAVAQYAPSYQQNAGVINPAALNTAPVKGSVYDYSAYGALRGANVDFTTGAQVNLPLNQATDLNLNPAASKFAAWNNLTYTGNVYDAQTQSYAYGFRNYNPASASWDKQDSYLGDKTNPLSRNRYGFTLGNPANNVDVDGFMSCGVDFFGAPCLASTVNNVVASKQANLRALQDAKSTVQKQISGLNTQLGKLNSSIKNLKWSAYNAGINLDLYTIMKGVIGRLQARGYALDYDKVYNYLGGQIQTRTMGYNRIQSQLSNARSAYYRAQNGISSLRSSLSQINSAQAQLRKQSQAIAQTKQASVWGSGISNFPINRGNPLLSALCIIPAGAIACGVYQGVVGKDFAGNILTTDQRSISLGLALIPFIGSDLSKGEGIANEVMLTENTSDELAWSSDKIIHVGEHELNDLNKPLQGVFYGNSFEVTNKAWSLKGTLEPISIAGRDTYVIPFENAGYQGGFWGQGQNLNSITVATESGSLNVVTSYPGVPNYPYKFLLSK